jgi:hypothetical protein
MQKNSELLFTKLFNLGLHLTQKNVLGSEKKNQAANLAKNYSYNRRGNKWLLQQPLHMPIQNLLLIKAFTKLLESGGRIAVINTGQGYKKGLTGEYLSFFEGVEIVCFEED